MKQALIPLAATIALATGTGSALAQSNVTLYGIVDGGFYSKQLSGQSRVRGIESGLMDTSHWGMLGSEDLGGGLRANFDLSAFMRIDSGDATRGLPGEGFFSRAAWVGLSGSMGAVRAGRISTPNFINTIRYNPFGASAALSPSFLHMYIGSAAQPMTTGSGATDSAWNNALAYASPRLGEFSLTLLAAPSEGSTAGRRIGGSLNYGGAPFAATLSMDSTKNAALAFPLAFPTLPGAVPPFTATDLDTVQLGASYDFKVVKLFAQLARTKIEGTRPGPPGTKTITLDTVQAGLSAPLGLGRALFSVARTEKSQTLLADQTRTTVSAGYNYDLSKRSDLYAVVMTDKVSGLNRGTGYALGMRHRF